MDAEEARARLADLLVRTGRGERACFADLYRLCSAKLLGVSLRILVSRELAEEALQESFVRIWSNAHRYDPATAGAMTWMIAIARNQAIDLRRKASERIAAGAVALEDAPLIDPAAGAEEGASLRRLRECLGGLSQEPRDMVLLAYHQGLSREELSARFARPVATVKTILRRSLAALRECLDGER